MITSPHIGKRVGKPVSVTRCVTFTRSGNILWAVLYHAVTDNTGSYVHLVNAITGNADFSASYDAWGRMTTAVNTLPFHRGYGGHEMLTEFGLVNMNGRMYDYNLGRFLSPDNYVQMPHDSQSFNRYSYCLNNPLKYTDPNGELFLLSAVKGFFKGLRKWISGKGNFTDIFTYAYKGAANDLKATFVMFFKGTFSQILSRFTFEAPQTAIGSLYTHAVFLLHDVDHVRYFDGATYIINISSKTNGVTIGNFININLMDSKLYPKNEKGDFDIRYDRNGIFMHEYGHYLQSQQLGWIYVFKVGIPSLISAIKSKEIKVNDGRYYLTTHKLSDVEIDANRKAERYFREKYDFHQWNIYEFPLFYDSHANWIGYPSRTSYFNYNPFKLFMTNY